MIKKETCGDITWIDLESPTREEVRSIVDEYKIQPIVGEELLSTTVRPKVDVYDNLIYLILHFPTVSHTDENQNEQEIDFIIGKDFFITVHYGQDDILEKSRKVFGINVILQQCTLGGHAGFLFFYLIKELYENLIADLEYIQKELEHIEHNIFLGKEHTMVFDLSKMTRKLLHFKRAMSQHQHVLESLESAGADFFPKKFSYHLRAITGECYRVLALFDVIKDTVNDLKATNDSLLATKTNDIIKILTIMAFITLPVTFLSQLFGMNTTYLPIVGLENDFWIVIGIMALVTLSFFGFFKFKKWF